MDGNKTRIITKRASKIRFSISNALGGIGKVEIAIIVIDFFITALIFSFLFKYQLIASVIITIFMWLTSLILMFPTKMVLSYIMLFELHSNIFLLKNIIMMF